MKRLMLSVLFALGSSVVTAAENNVNNVLNGNGSVGNVTINQTNSMTNEQVEAQKRIDEALFYAYKQQKNGTPSKEANEKSLVAGMASDINKQLGTMEQKNNLCKSKVKISAEILGYNLDLAFRTCDELFVTQ